jgi:hypothetical protein
MISHAPHLESPTQGTPTPNIEEQTLIVSSHVIIRDPQTKHILVNKRGS